MRFVFALDRPAPVLAVLCLMVVAAARAAVGRSSRRFAGLTWLALLVLAVTGFAITAAVTQVVIGVDPWYKPQYVLPLLGMLLGNTLTALSLAIDHMLEQLDVQRAEVEADLARAGRTDDVADTIDYGPLIAICAEVVERRSFRLLEAIAQALLIATNGLQDFENAKQLAKFVGVCATQCESGSSIKKRGGISKTGDPNLRALLYMGARSAKRFNQPCKELYERLRGRGKCHKVAMLAVCNKMLRQVFAVVKSGVEFDNEYHLKNEKAA